MTIPIDEQKARKRAKKDEQIRDAYADAILKDLESSDALARRAAMKLHAESLIQRVEALQAELHELKKAAGNTADLDAAVAAKNAAESELEKIKAEWSATVNAEVKKVQDAVSDERLALVQREVAVKRKEDAMAVSTDAALTAKAFERFHRLVKHVPASEFFDHEAGNPISPWFWAGWMPMERAQTWCAYEAELMKLPREKQLAVMARDMHCRTCIQHSREKIDLSQEKADFLVDRLRFLGAEVQNEIYKQTREMTEYCRLQPHPMANHNVDYEYGAKRNMQTRLITGDLPRYL
jgi:hypothetical protein